MVGDADRGEFVVAFEGFGKGVFPDDLDFGRKGDRAARSHIIKKSSADGYKSIRIRKRVAGSKSMQTNFGCDGGETKRRQIFAVQKGVTADTKHSVRDVYTG